LTDGCLVCGKHAGAPAPPGGPVYEDELVFASHVFDMEGGGEPAYLGHVVVEPRRHVAGLGDLTPGEAAAGGRVLASVARALVVAEGAEHVYSAVMGHHYAHLHVHAFARYPGTPREYWFMRVDEWPGAPKGGPEEIAAVAQRLRAAVAAEG